MYPCCCLCFGFSSSEMINSTYLQKSLCNDSLLVKVKINVYRKLYWIKESLQGYFKNLNINIYGFLH